MACELWKQAAKGVLCSEALIAKIYFTKVQSSAQALDSFSPPGKMPPTKFFMPTKQKFSCYNPTKTSVLAVVVAPGPFPF